MRLRRLALTIFSLLLLTGSVLTACAPKTTSVTDVSPSEASALISGKADDPDFIILDVRTPQEFAAGRIEGSINMDVNSPEFRSAVGALDREDDYLVYCRTGNRSGQAIEVMKELDFQTIYHLRSGVVGWTEAGLPLEP